MTGETKHTRPDCIVLGVKPGVSPGSGPPVRIFLGTQAEQYRAERVFFWSIEQVRDPSRVYEIYLMKGMSGFRRTWLWNTGFTNYRFAIPGYGGYQGRAIYNDVDQTYHEDPAKLFDMDMGDHAVLAVSQTDTSVMLMDCGRMKKFWTLDKARTRRKYPLIAAVQAEEGAYGLFDDGWNVRDMPFIPGQSKCYHYTILHYQPWQPLRERFYYRPNKEGGKLWHDLEQGADRAGFQIFTAVRPSPHFDDLLETRADVFEGNFAPGMLDTVAADLSAGTSATAILEINGRRLTDLVREMRTAQHGEKYDGLVIQADLSLWPKQDLPWILDALFARAGKFIAGTLRVPEAARDRKGPRRMAMAKAAEWWNWALGAASAHYPEVCWRFVLAPRLDSGVDDFDYCRGGPCPTSALPAVWILSDEKPGHRTQSLGLANALGWPCEEKKLQFNFRGELPNALVKDTIKSLTASSHAIAGPPWPDLVIATGRRTAPIAAWVRQHSLGKTRTVQMGRIGISRDDHFDLGVAPVYAGLYPDPRRMETVLPLTRVNQVSLDKAAEQWRARFSTDSRPLLALLVGGTNVEHEFSPACARELGESVKSMVDAAGGKVLVSTSRRTSEPAAEALLAALGSCCAHAYIWQRDKDICDNPYMAYLACAAALVVTGESASMLAEACSTGKPVAIFPLPVRSASPVTWLRTLGRMLGDAVARRAYARPLNKRGVERPQRGIQRFCAGLLARGLVRTGGHSKQLHEALVSRGLAVIYDGRLPPLPTAGVNEEDHVADRVRTLMGRAS